jgi:hypothetical protein
MPTVFSPGQRQIHINRGFVLMPFAPDFRNVYAAVRSVVSDYAHCECVRADEIARSNRITDEVFEQIQRARFLIADITGQNPNVFYELGVAHALERPVIVLVQTGTEIPIDISGIRFLEYSIDDLGDLQAKLGEFIKSALQTVPDQWRTEMTSVGPDIRISRLEWPRHAVPNQPARIRVLARNYGETTNTAYFSLSFPFEVSDEVKIIESSLPDTRIGHDGQRWKSDHAMLQYPIAEAYMWRSESEWKSKVVHSLAIEVVPMQTGLIQFYVSSSTFSADGRHFLDPASSTLLDQRDEPVYCAVIEVT